ncbi:hypothetical protein CRE_06747 [Caenorhabditis remanei]|uniref:Uncharacterized protein n=1 Tax=Caenorhabditis remanei TaxID=31234 RepID=E3MNX9_CAERE|nr:hypothetical protein CRE_06747 [Caenorhabditis remanei]
MTDKEESKKSARSLVSSSSGGEGDELEGASGTAVRMRKKSKKRAKKSSKTNSKTRKDDVPACDTVEKVSMKSGNETSQSEWLNDILQEDAPKLSVSLAINCWFHG